MASVVKPTAWGSVGTRGVSLKPESMWETPRYGRPNRTMCDHSILRPCLPSWLALLYKPVWWGFSFVEEFLASPKDVLATSNGKNTNFQEGLKNCHPTLTVC